MARAMTEAKLKGVHAHGCTNCHWRYEDACSDPLTNQICVECRSGLPGFIDLKVSRRPQACCRENSRLATIEEMEKYNLGGSAPWYFCPPARGGCARTHPYDDPKLEEDFDDIIATIASG